MMRGMNEYLTKSNSTYKAADKWRERENEREKSVSFTPEILLITSPTLIYMRRY
jgi:hypothetical protein